MTPPFGSGNVMVMKWALMQSSAVGLLRVVFLVADLLTDPSFAMTNLMISLP
ncbi:MAG: hypothetical protein ACI8RZ_003734 [Myxococcota bacterium]|jgi:hypothetical protein